MEELETLEKAKDKFKSVLEKAKEFGLSHPRHTEIIIFDDEDYRIEAKKGKSLGEITDKGVEKLEIKKLVYKKEDNEFFYRKILQTEANPSKEILEEERLTFPKN
ncbi:MAG: hypothetical protein MUP58_01940 [Candidatus Nanohaloarchaeota archaeon QJJ-9]|nr:hypothetical protein [Candidatus Nanohaloarchaeota archaeon QJJ-9]